MGTLYIIGTPIGNLEDVTFRAVDILSQVSLIAAEDTRVTQKLLARYDIKTKKTSFLQFFLQEKTKKTNWLISLYLFSRSIGISEGP